MSMKARWMPTRDTPTSGRHGESNRSDDVARGGAGIRVEVDSGE